MTPDSPGDRGSTELSAMGNAPCPILTQSPDAALTVLVLHLCLLFVVFGLRSSPDLFRSHWVRRLVLALTSAHAHSRDWIDFAPRCGTSVMPTCSLFDVGPAFEFMSPWSLAKRFLQAEAVVVVLVACRATWVEAADGGYEVRP